MTTPIQALELSRRLFEQRGRPLLQQLDLFNVCAVGCFGGTSQNANLDDDWSRDHMWGPYLTFVLKGKVYNEHASALEQAIAKMPDEIDGARVGSATMDLSHVGPASKKRMHFFV